MFSTSLALMISASFLSPAGASVPTKPLPVVAPAKTLSPAAVPMKLQPSINDQLVAKAKGSSANQITLIFDIPVTFNARVAFWLEFFQTRGKTWFREWLEKSTKYMPFIQRELKLAGLPADLGYMVMIESGFNANAASVAKAMGPWQFIQPTGARYGLRVSWWLDERRDLLKATRAATRYMRDLHQEFGSWYLVAASYNMGENGLRRQIKKHGTRDFWALSRAKAIPQETMDYVPKILAAMLISKAPSLYGFRDLARMDALEYDAVLAAGGTDLAQLADHLGVTPKALKDLNAEMIVGYVPVQVEKHLIRVPKGAEKAATDFLRKKFPFPGTAQTLNSPNPASAGKEASTTKL